MLIAHQLKKTLEVEHVTFTKDPNGPKRARWLIIHGTSPPIRVQCEIKRFCKGRQSHRRS